MSYLANLFLPKFATISFSNFLDEFLFFSSRSKLSIAIELVCWSSRCRTLNTNSWHILICLITISFNISVSEVRFNPGKSMFMWVNISHPYLLCGHSSWWKTSHCASLLCILTKVRFAGKGIRIKTSIGIDFNKSTHYMALFCTDVRQAFTRSPTEMPLFQQSADVVYHG